MLDQDARERLVRVETETKAQTKILTEICRDVKALTKSTANHALEDEARFGKIDLAIANKFGEMDNRIGKTESDVRWTKRIGTVVLGILHAAHFTMTK